MRNNAEIHRTITQTQNQAQAPGCTWVPDEEYTKNAQQQQNTDPQQQQHIKNTIKYHDNLKYYGQSAINPQHQQEGTGGEADTRFQNKDQKNGQCMINKFEIHHDDNNIPTDV